MPRRANMTQKIDRGLNEQGHIRLGSRTRRKQKEEKNATKRCRRSTAQFHLTEGDARAIVTDVPVHLFGLQSGNWSAQ
jgi:hypothetical protein